MAGPKVFSGADVLAGTRILFVDPAWAESAPKVEQTRSRYAFVSERNSATVRRFREQAAGKSAEQ